VSEIAASAHSNSPHDNSAHDNTAERTALLVLIAISFCHLLNDMMQSLLAAIYPMLKESYALDFGQIGLITLVFQVTASLLQPLVGLYTDRRPQTYALCIGMSFTLCGLLLLAYAASYPLLLVAAALVGTGSSVFHPESSRVARAASGGRHGLAQSVFQVGGNIGSAVGPLAAAFIILPRGQSSVAWFSFAAMLAIMVLARVSAWHRTHRRAKAKSRAPIELHRPSLSRRQIGIAIAVLLVLIFSKYFYVASLSNYLTFYLMSKFAVSVQSAQLYLFVFLGASALGTVVGGPLGDRVGRKWVIWVSILGALPFTLALPYANLFWTCMLHRHRPHHLIGLLGDPGLCPGAGAGTGRHDRRIVLRLRLRHGRRGRRGAGRSRRPDQHRFRLPRLRLPAGARHRHRVAAESRDGDVAPA
jgi:FSR family fosmidomycin resistance protein-like MFS transporter